ncbi:hypothetical protein B0T09DRAFT_10195 [Sordaria sp. MPI-SDFR-AT-0083]|nr:hypothetical protein B0T09DRAFT_10195 [Sordaria sp. MPI-SDFR-AT-0083]
MLCLVHRVPSGSIHHFPATKDPNPSWWDVPRGWTAPSIILLSQLILPFSCLPAVCFLLGYGSDSNCRARPGPLAEHTDLLVNPFPAQSIMRLHLKLQTGRKIDVNCCAPETAEILSELPTTRILFCHSATPSSNFPKSFTGSCVCHHHEGVSLSQAALHHYEANSGSPPSTPETFVLDVHGDGGPRLNYTLTSFHVSISPSKTRPVPSHCTGRSKLRLR